MVGKGAGVTWGLTIRRVCVAALATALMTGALVTATSPASASILPKPSAAEAVLTPVQLAQQLRVAKALRADLLRSGALVAATSSRLERLSAQANNFLAELSATRSAQVAAETEAADQRARLVELGRQVRAAGSALGQLASDSYIRGGGPLGDMAAILEALTATSPDRSTNSIATAQYLVHARSRILHRVESLRTDQVTTSAKAAAASARASAAARRATKAKSALDAVIVDQRAALGRFKAAEAGLIDRSAEVRGRLLRSEEALARAAERQLAITLAGKDLTLLMNQSPGCGKSRRVFANGRWPAAYLCPLYAAPGESLQRAAALAFNAMSSAYQKQAGSALCVTDGYRSYAEQVAVKRARPGLAATPGRSQHGLGLAVDLCGGVQSFSSPAHLWMKRNAPLYGWFHPSWADPSGELPEPWHWEFAS